MLKLILLNTLQIIFSYQKPSVEIIEISALRSKKMVTMTSPDENKKEGEQNTGHPLYQLRIILTYFSSKRSRFITLSQAVTKSVTNFSFASALAYTSANALNSELEPKTKSTVVAVHLTSPVLRSRPS